MIQLLRYLIGQWLRWLGDAIMPPATTSPPPMADLFDDVFDAVAGRGSQPDPECPNCQCGGDLCDEHGTGELHDWGKR
jgi:hypothetical protein